MSSNLSRRSFLKGAAALAVVSAASGVLAGCSATGSTSGVTGSGAARVFKDGENVITITSTGINVYNKAGTDTMMVVPSFKVDNKTKTALKFAADANGVSGYTMVVAATFDGKKPDAAPVKAEADATTTSGSSGSTTTSLPLYGGNMKDFYTTTATESKISEGVLAFKAPFTNWNQMVITMTLYKDTDDGDVKVGTTTFTFNQ